MASADWTYLSDILDANNVDRGVTTGIARPSGGGSFVYGFNSLTVNVGGVGLFANQVNFAPMSKGCRITGCVKRLPSGGNTGFAPFFFVGLGGTSLNDSGYLLGLADADPYHIVLKKGSPSNGLDDLSPDPVNNGVLLRSSASYSIDDDAIWHHLRLDFIVNTNGDVLLQCFENDLATNPLSGSPSWVAIAGMTEFIDDALQINTGSAPKTSGRAGIGFYTEDVTRRAAFDHVEIARQL